MKPELPKTLMELQADRVAAARRELDASKAALDLNGGHAAEQRYAWALYEYDLVHGMFPSVARGAGDVKA